MKTLRWGDVMLATMVAVHGLGTAFGQPITGDLDVNRQGRTHKGFYAADFRSGAAARPDEAFVRAWIRERA